MEATPTISPILIRMPGDIKQWLKAAAKAERRTMTAQLLHILEQAKHHKQEAA